MKEIDLKTKIYRSCLNLYSANNKKLLFINYNPNFTENNS